MYKDEGASVPHVVPVTKMLPVTTLVLCIWQCARCVCIGGNTHTLLFAVYRCCWDALLYAIKQLNGTYHVYYGVGLVC